MDEDSSESWYLVLIVISLVFDVGLGFCLWRALRARRRVAVASDRYAAVSDPNTSPPVRIHRKLRVRYQLQSPVRVTRKTRTAISTRDHSSAESLATAAMATAVDKTAEGDACVAVLTTSCGGSFQNTSGVEAQLDRAPERSCSDAGRPESCKVADAVPSWDHGVTDVCDGQATTKEESEEQALSEGIGPSLPLPTAITTPKMEGGLLAQVLNDNVGCVRISTD